MTQIIPFRIRPEKRLQRPVPGGEAQIFMFTGVRYERTDGTDAASGKPSGPAQQAGRRQRRS